MQKEPPCLTPDAPFPQERMVEAVDRIVEFTNAHLA